MNKYNYKFWSWMKFMKSNLLKNNNNQFMKIRKKILRKRKRKRKIKKYKNGIYRKDKK